MINLSTPLPIVLRSAEVHPVFAWFVLKFVCRTSLVVLLLCFCPLAGFVLKVVCLPGLSYFCTLSVCWICASHFRACLYFCTFAGLVRLTSCTSAFFCILYWGIPCTLPLYLVVFHYMDNFHFCNCIICCLFIWRSFITWIISTFATVCSYAVQE